VAAQDLKAAAESLTGRPSTFVINSHVHADHWGGNQVFAGRCPIISTHAIRTGMPEATAWLMDLKENPAELRQTIEQERCELEEETDPRQTASLESSIARMTGWLDVLPTLELCLPDQTFEGRLAFHGPKRSVELVEVSPGHTSNDVYLALPADHVVFMGDLGFLQTQPFMVYCQPVAWIAHLEKMEGSDLKIFVPGHGPVGSKDDVALQRRYIVLIEELVARVVSEGGTPDDAVAEPLPPPFAGWLHGSMGRWQANIQSSFERLTGNVTD
jgi:glyoxylase-like metal-dependent hydrolase (beta-lactamase superfamily II)